MEPSSVVPDSNAPSTGAASHLLANLPSRGFMSSAVPSSNLGGMRVYLCDRDTSPPEHQVIKTDQMNILIRALTLKKKGETKAAPSAMISRKRTSERTHDGRASTKKAMTNAESSGQRDGSSSGTSGNIEYQRMTVDRLRTILREKGLSPKGKKDELIARLRSSGK